MSTDHGIIKRTTLESAALAEHDKLTRAYYSNPEGFPGGKEAFDEQHGRIWTDLEAALEEIKPSETP